MSSAANVCVGVVVFDLSVGSYVVKASHGGLAAGGSYSFADNVGAASAGDRIVMGLTIVRTSGHQPVVLQISDVGAYTFNPYGSGGGGGGGDVWPAGNAVVLALSVALVAGAAPIVAINALRKRAGEK